MSRGCAREREIGAGACVKNRDRRRENTVHGGPNDSGIDSLSTGSLAHPFAHLLATLTSLTASLVGMRFFWYEMNASPAYSYNPLCGVRMRTGLGSHRGVPRRTVGQSQVILRHQITFSHELGGE